MRATRALIGPILIVTLAAPAAAQVREEWVARYGAPGGGSAGGSDLAVDSSGNVCVTGYTHASNEEDAGYATIKYDTDGTELWVATYDGTAGDDDAASSIVLDGDGNIYVTGTSWELGTERDYTILKYDEAGAQVWGAHYDGPESSTDRSHDIALDGAGNVYVTGMSENAGTNRDFTTIKYAPMAGVEDESATGMRLAPARPNPFTADTALHFEIGDPDRWATLAIYNVRGQLVKTLVDSDVPGGRHTARWDGTDSRGEPAAAGVYLARLEAGAETTTRRVVLTR